MGSQSKNLPYLLQASLVSHASTDEGEACIEFNVRDDKTLYTIQVLQSRDSQGIEIHVVDPEMLTLQHFEIPSWSRHGSVYELHSFDIMPDNFVRMSLNPEAREYWVIQFENLFKLHQFRQLHQMHAQPSQAQVNILTVTWNHGREVQTGNIDVEKLFPNYQNYNIIAYGCQECHSHEAEVQFILEHLHRDFELIDMVGKGELMLAIFIKKTDRQMVRNIAKNYVVRDMLGYGWKGAVMIRFCLHDTSFSFINSHLESGQTKTLARMNMARDVLREIGLFKEDEMIETDSAADFNFFFGDMNFRINSTYTKFMPNIEHASQLVNQMDQLNKLREVEGIFPDYIEPEITFKPTYKLKKHINEYTNKKEQCPSYTDRILTKSNSCLESQIIQYGSHEEFWGSDHRPVFTRMKVITQRAPLIDPTSIMDPQRPI